MEDVQKMSKVRKGWEMSKSAWRVLMLDKELVSLPLLSMVASIVLLIPLGLIFLGLSGSIHTGPFSISVGQHANAGIWQWPLYIAMYFVLTLVANFFTGAVIYGATQRFRGEDPTVRSSLAAAWHRIGPLALFSLLMATVGLALQTLEERLPLAGRIAAWLVGAAWNIANFFALPVIMLSDHKVAPLDATKQSVQVVRKVWGESVVAEAGVTIIGLLAVVAYMFTAGVIGFGIAAAVSALSLPTVIGVPVWGLMFLGLFAVILVFSVLGGIVKAAIYHYATTGESPVTFNRNLLQASMSPKKARKIFS